MTKHTKPKLFRDPVHDIISLSTQSDEGRLMLALIDTPEFQRLRYIRQLAMSHTVYHGAEHSRFSHSMGVMHVSGLMLETLAQRTTITPWERLVTRAAALLHDIGHGPYSHALEAVTGQRHEHRSVGIIRAPETAVHQVLAAVDADLPDQVADCIMGQGTHPLLLRQVVSSQLDADRLDYILRDGHATGVKIGLFDLGRILTLLDVHDGHLAVHVGAQEAVEGYLLARFHMYKQVYLHRTSRAAERMLVAALRRAALLHLGGEALPWWPTGPLGDLLTGQELGHADYATLDDHDVWVCLKRWTEASDRALADLSRGLVERRLYKTLVLPSNDPDRADELVASARSLARVKGFDPEFHMLVDGSSGSSYRPFVGVDGVSGSIRLVDSAGRGGFIEDRSSVIRMMGGLRHEQRLLCFHPELRPAIQRQLVP